jgi:large conductance mechanosensitive channel
MGLLAEFKAFLLKTNALALAIGVVIGAAIGKVVSSIVADLIMPIIGHVTPSGDWRALTVGPKDEFKIGDFLGNVVDFCIIAFVVFLITKALLREKPKPATTKACPQCLEQVPLEAKRCRACTSTL